VCSSDLYTGDPNELIRQLACERLLDLTVQDAALEDVFLGYYRTQDERRPASRPKARR